MPTATMLSVKELCVRGSGIVDPEAKETESYRCLKKTVLRDGVARDSERSGEHFLHFILKFPLNYGFLYDKMH